MSGYPPPPNNNTQGYPAPNAPPMQQNPYQGGYQQPPPQGYQQPPPQAYQNAPPQYQPQPQNSYMGYQPVVENHHAAAAHVHVVHDGGRIRSQANVAIVLAVLGLCFWWILPLIGLIIASRAQRRAAYVRRVEGRRVAGSLPLVAIILNIVVLVVNTVGLILLLNGLGVFVGGGGWGCGCGYWDDYWYYDDFYYDDFCYYYCY